MNDYAPPNDEPEVDDAAWNAWVRKNEAKDKIRSVRRKKILGFLVMLGIIVALLWRFSL